MIVILASFFIYVFVAINGVFSDLSRICQCLMGEGLTAVISDNR